MMSFFIYVSAIMLIMISFIHVYWAFGGRWGSSAALPQKVGGGVVFKPRMPETLAVACLILIVSFILMAQSESLPFFKANPFTEWSCIICAFVFFIRAVGDFKYLGFFKKIKHSTFSEYDTWIYSPLCLYLAFSFMIALR